LYALTTSVNIVSMSGQLDRIMDAAYGCFVRHGVRKTTMEDIAKAAGMSRPAVYQYVTNKDDAFRRLAGQLYGEAFAVAVRAAEAEGTLTQRLDRVLAVRLDLLARVHHETPHAAELIGPASKVAADLDQAFLRDLAGLLTGTIVAAAAEADLPLADGNAREVVALALALTRGLEADLTAANPTTSNRTAAERPDPVEIRDRLRNGIALLIAGLSAAVRPTA
jgi:TetR/AcrR family transcriptional regulator